jgi:hypothetical protein
MLKALFGIAGLLFGLALIVRAAADFPQATISNGQIRAKLYLPDPQQGYYRGTRFDWSGVIASLEYQGHNYFGPWFARHDPLIHDAITGPVEEFRNQDTALGYDQAKPGENFIKIGIGALRKPEEPSFRRFGFYEVAKPGRWTLHKKSDRIEFIHELTDASGYGYIYRKTVRLAKDKPELLLEHSLKNSGKKTIETTVYNHNFLVIDGQPSGPDFSVLFPFEPRVTGDLKGLAEFRGGQLAYLKELQADQSLMLYLQGFGKTVKDYDLRIENRKAGAGVRIVGDQPLSDMLFWSIRTTLCPEPYIALKIEPGQESRWRISYTFYTLQ